MASDIQIISDAFINLGSPPVNSPLTDNPIEAGAADIYDHILPEVLVLHPWRFAMRNFELSKLTEESPFDRWNDVYELPAEMLLAYRTDPLVNYEIFDHKLYTNVGSEANLKLEFIFRAVESTFPPYFTELMVLKLTSRIAMLVTQKPELAKFWDQKATTQLVIARGLDSSIMPNPVIVRDPIWEAHFGTGSMRFGSGFR